MKYLQCVVNERGESYVAAGVGSLNSGEVLHIGVEHVHLLNQAGQGCLSSLTNLLIGLLGLEKQKEMETFG